MTHNREIPSVILEHIKELNALVEKYLRNIPVTVIASRLLPMYESMVRVGHTG